jgi:hypothetical protein
MTPKRILLAVMVPVVLAIAWSVRGPAAAQEKKADPGRPALKWEYKVFRANQDSREVAPDKMEAALNKLGEEGWECVGTVSEVTGSAQQGTWTHATLVCKRPKQ